MSNYYFLTSYLPPLVLGEIPEINLRQLYDLLSYTLKPSDLVKSRILQNYFDIYNLRLLWLGRPLNERGGLNPSDLSEAVVTYDGLPYYVYEFLEKYPSVEKRLQYFPSLVHDFFIKEIERSEGFTKKYLQFARQWRLVVLGFRAKQLGRDLIEELQFEDPTDDIVAQILAQKDSKTYDPPEEYSNLKLLFNTHYNSPLELEHALLEYRFNKVEEMLEQELFSIDWILGYMVKLSIVEQWQELNNQEGLTIVDSMLQGKK